jgi:hypothetical protein
VLEREIVRWIVHVHAEVLVDMASLVKIPGYVYFKRVVMDRYVAVFSTKDKSMVATRVDAQ